MIYCVIPRALADELYEPLAAYYRDELIIERGEGADRRREQGSQVDNRRETRDRPRPGVVGTFPSTDVPE